MDKKTKYLLIMLIFLLVFPKILIAKENKILYEPLEKNVQLSEFQFAHYDRFYLGTSSEYLEEYIGKASEVIKLENGAMILKYIKNYIINDTIAPRVYATFYFNDPDAIKNSNLTGLYAKKYLVNHGKSYDQVVELFGNPTVEKDIGDGGKYVAYSLREGQNRYAYFVLKDDKVIYEGTMYGNDYSSLK
ncbi:MAG: hypothetical protein FWC47_17210 [Oscillospiraceae bacterium]|nr:hypothetical protein [Oscillospiraceae bacterium]